MPPVCQVRFSKRTASVPVMLGVMAPGVDGADGDDWFFGEAVAAGEEHGQPAVGGDGVR